MTEQSPTRWMVRVKDGATFMFDGDSFTKKDEKGRPQFLEITCDLATLIGQLPRDIGPTLFDESEDGKGWVLTAFGWDFLSRDARAGEAFEQGQPEAVEVLEERKAWLSVLMQDDPHPLAYALAQLCFKPNSADPRYARSQGAVAQRNREKVEADAGKGKPRLFESGNPHVRIMDLVRYLAEDEQRHYPVCDFLWRHAYRQIVAEGWKPESPRPESVMPHLTAAGKKDDLKHSGVTRDGAVKHPGAPKPKAGRKADPERMKRDMLIFKARQGGSSIEFLAESYNCSQREIKEAIDRARKRVERKEG